jgi:hypothetical protein
MKIAILIEGLTERAFKPFLLDFLQGQLAGRMPKLDFVPQHGGLPTNDKLKRVVEKLLQGASAADHVIALSDVYTGHRPPLFNDAAEAKRKMHSWVANNPRFFPHAAQHDFEAWLIPYWTKIQKLAQSNRARPGHDPESVNHNNPPAYRIKEIFEIGACKKSYSKTIDGPRILRGENLMISINECPEFKAFVNRIIELSGGTPIT